VLCSARSGLSTGTAATWTGEVAAELGVPAWLDRAAQRAERLAANAGPHGDGLRRALAARMRGWEAPVR
jgi:hypothetical protein